ncbi:hypothetical protein DL96DRAFT_270288 [Flagelloscypha sp. PMI_526]|nr:hypothetical protein DL96DRAFT_270288 [Flagelloscypha sp. PMI_526]
MDFLNVGANTLGKIMEATSIIMRTLQAQHAEPLPPLPIDLVRLVCEYAATLDTRTAGNLYATSKDIREWVAPVRFQSIEIRNYQSFMRLRVPEVMKRISPHVFTVSLQPEAGDTCKQGGIFMKAYSLKRLGKFYHYIASSCCLSRGRPKVFARS